jgi:uncharacterized protein YjiS (DUF1127 family)
MSDVSQTGRYTSALALASLRTTAARLIGTWLTRVRSRRALRRLDDRLRRDIGVDRYAAMAEARKPFWRA